MANVIVVGEVWTPNAGYTPVGTALDTSSTFVFALTKGKSGVLVVDNTGTVATATVSILPGDNPPSVTRGAGTLSVVVGTAGAHKSHILLESARFTQDDGTILVTCTGFSAGTLNMFEMPRGY